MTFSLYFIFKKTWIESHKISHFKSIVYKVINHFLHATKTTNYQNISNPRISIERRLKCDICYIRKTQLDLFHLD